MTDMKTWTTAAGWYPDPERADQQRYWDGQQWTEHFAPLGQQSVPTQPQGLAGSKAPLYKRRWFITVAVVFGLVVLAGIFGGGADPQPTTPLADTDGASRAATAPEPVTVSLTVPGVVGLDEREATAALEDAGFEVLVRRVEVEGAKKGAVVRQSPEAGTEVDEGSSVTIGVATGVVSVEVPDVTGMKLAKARGVLRGEGFEVDVTKIEDDSVPAGQIVEQSPSGETGKGGTISLTVAKAPKPQLTSGQENALRTAEDYLEYAAFSRTGLIQQLEYEGYSTEDATFAVDHMSVNWKEQAAQSARDYLEMSGFSRTGLIQQLEYEGYTNEQATYGVDQAM